jgi:hypothetical protein
MGVQVLVIRAMGHGSRLMCRTDKYGFPQQHKARRAVYFGFRTGDLVRAVLPSGKYAGTHIGRIAVRATGRFRIGSVDVPCKYCRRLLRADGYSYQLKREVSSSLDALADGPRSPGSVPAIT